MFCMVYIFDASPLYFNKHPLVNIIFTINSPIKHDIFSVQPISEIIMLLFAQQTGHTAQELFPSESIQYV